MQTPMNYLLALLTALAAIGPMGASAQSYQVYNWDNAPKLSVLKGDEAKQPEITILRHVQYEYAYEKNNQHQLPYPPLP